MCPNVNGTSRSSVNGSCRCVRALNQLMLEGAHITMFSRSLRTFIRYYQVFMPETLLFETQTIGMYIIKNTYRTVVSFEIQQVQHVCLNKICCKVYNSKNLGVSNNPLHVHTYLYTLANNFCPSLYYVVEGLFLLFAFD